MTITINGTDGITTPEVTLDNTSADGGQVVLKSSGYSNWNLDNYSGRFRAYYNSTEYFTVTNSGNVGIGTSSPSKKLDVNGSINANSIEVGLNGESIKKASGSLYIETGSANPLIFTTNSAERMRIDSSGRLLVNTTTSGGWSGDQTFSACATGSSLAWAVSAYNSTTSNGGAILSRVDNTSRALAAFYYTASTNVGNITTNGTGTTYATSSDYRLKENVQPMTGALSVVAALKPCTYTWKADGSDGQGFIAHELQEVVPDCVTGEKDAVDADGNPKYQGIDTSFLVATLTAAIQELKAIVDEQAAKITALENK